MEDKSILLEHEFLPETKTFKQKDLKKHREKNVFENHNAVDVNCNELTFVKQDCCYDESCVKESAPRSLTEKHKLSESERGRGAQRISAPNAVYLRQQTAEEDRDTVCLIFHDYNEPPPVSHEHTKTGQTRGHEVRLGSHSISNITSSVPLSVQTNLPVLKMNLSFAGSGFLGIYHLGVARALLTHGNRLLVNVQHFTGASAGILVASVLAIKGADLDALNRSREFTFNLARAAKKKSLGVLTPRFSLLAPLEEFLEEMCPENAAEVASGRLHVSLTKLKGGKNVTVSEFHSKQHLIQCLLASSYIPFVTGTKIFTIQGEKYVDGGLTDNLPVLAHGRTVTVTPFCGKEDICPVDARGRGGFTKMGNMSVQASPDNMKRLMHALFPPDAAALQRYHDRGYRDTVRFLKREGFYE